MLARASRKVDRSIKHVLWFPSKKQIRLVEITGDIPSNADGHVHAYHFPADPEKELDLPMAIALIRPEEKGRLRLPSTWGSWRKAVDVSG